MRFYYVLLIFIAILIGWSFITQQTSFNQKKHLRCNGKQCNVILIVADTLGAKHMDIYGYERSTMPFVKKFFSQSSIIFDNASSNATWTEPSFASFLSSQYPNASLRESFSKSPPQDSLISLIKKNNITVEAFLRTVFDKRDNANKIIGNNFSEQEKFMAHDPLQILGASEWIDERVKSGRKDKPFFLLVHTWFPHHPYMPRKKYQFLFNTSNKNLGEIGTEELNTMQKALLNNTENKEVLEQYTLQYDQQLRYGDDALKDFLSNLPKNILDSTVIIFIADHGEGFGEHRFVSHGFPPYEEVIHVPFLMYVPGIEEKRITTQVSLLDLAPTILDVYGIQIPPSYKGNSLLPTIYGQRLPERIIKSVTETPQWLQLTEEDLQGHAVDISRGWYTALKNGKWKLMKKPNTIFELYDLSKDPLEQRNLIQSWQSYPEADREIIQGLLQQAEKEK